MKIKKILAVSCLASALLLSACNGGGSSSSGGPIAIDTNVPKEALGTYDITIWGSETKGVKELFLKQVEDFCKLNEGLTLNVTYEEVSEANVNSKVLADIDAAADIYCFAQDQFADLVQGQALNRLGETAAKAVRANNSEGSVAAVTAGDALYAYPMTADNGYFMYYDTRVVKQNHLGSLEDIVADCEAAGKNFAMEVPTSAWYLASFFFGAGCTSEWTTDKTGAFINVTDDFNSDKGLIAMRGMQHLIKSPNYVSSSTVAQFNEAIPAGVVVSGTWDYNNAVAALGENLGVAELPSFKVDGKSYHLGSFAGFKLMGVKPTTDVKRARVLSTLALYLTGEKCQEERFDAVAWGPSNKVVSKMNKVQANPALAALLAQSAYARPQNAIPGAWWDFAKTLGTEAAAAANDDATALRAALANYQASVNNVVNPTEVPHWALVGSFGSWDAPTSIAFGEGDKVTQALDAGVEFKVCKVDSSSVVEWTYGASAATATETAAPYFDLTGDNIKVVTAGTFVISVTATGVALDLAA